MQGRAATLWDELLRAVPGCFELLTWREQGLRHFALTPRGCAGAALSAFLSNTALVVLIFLVSPDQPVSAAVIILWLCGSVLLREAAAYWIIAEAGQGGDYFAYGVPSLWTAALQPVLGAILTFGLLYLAALLGASQETLTTLIALVIGGVILGGIVIAVRTLSAGAGLSAARIVFVIGLQAIATFLGFLGFGIALQMAG